MNEPCQRETCPSVVTKDRLQTPNSTPARLRYCSDLCYDQDQRWRRSAARARTTDNEAAREHFHQELLALAEVSEALNGWRTVVDERPIKAPV